MKKSQYCTDHFVLGCKLCGMETTSEAVVVAPLDHGPVGITTEVVQTAANAFVNNHAVTGNHEPPKIQSEEAQAVVSVTEEYARSCDSHKQALEAVSNTRQHIDKMGLVLNELLADADKKKKLKDELKRKVLETLAMGGE